MKSTYKLIGEYWDGRLETESTVPVIEFDPTISDIGASPCLFDLVSLRRRVRLSALLAINSDYELSDIVAKISGCDVIAIELDCMPSHHGTVQERFLRKRALQVVRALRISLPSSGIVFMLPEKRRAA